MNSMLNYIVDEIKFDYSLCKYKSLNEKVEIKCNIHNIIFKQTPKLHFRYKGGCPECRKDKKTYDTKEFIEIANKIHNYKYNYNKSIYIKNNKKIIIECSLHGDFSQYPNNHINMKQGCPKCKHEFMRIKKDDFIKRANLIHNNKFDYSKVEYLNNNCFISVICPIHGDFSQKLNWHLNGNGCSKCKKSKGEIKISKILDELNINYIEQYKFNDCLSSKKRCLSFDFYLSSLNLCIEYNGLQHYKPVDIFGGLKRYNEQIHNDNIKKEYCKLNNIKLIIIPFDCLNIRDFLLNQIQ